jgi:hypothetical protein
VTAYQNAYDCYLTACEKYEQLITAYKTLKNLRNEKPANALPDDVSDEMPYTEKIMRRMIEDAHIEKGVIAGHARDCIRHLNSLKYELL